MMPCYSVGVLTAVMYWVGPVVECASASVGQLVSRGGGSQVLERGQ